MIRHQAPDPRSDGPDRLDLTAFPQPPEWTLDALCAQVDADMFFPEKGGSTREAKRICAMCPVAAECLDYALEHDEGFGIYGGMSERERRKLRTQLNQENP